MLGTSSFCSSYVHVLLLDAVLTITSTFQVAAAQVQEQIFHSEEG